MDIESDDVNVRETEGLAKRIEDTVVIDDTDSGSVDPLSAAAELEPQVNDHLLAGFCLRYIQHFIDGCLCLHRVKY